MRFDKARWLRGVRFDRRFAEVAAVSFLALLSSALGSYYATTNTDPHHWGFILGTALDFLHGRSLFDQVYIQYGAGQAMFFRLASILIPIDYTSIGVVTSVVYSLTLVLVYLAARALASPSIAAVVTGLVLVAHPFAVLPWPDYYAGFCLAAAVLLLALDNARGASQRSIAAGLALFLAFLFRSTYLLNFGAAAVVYLALSALRPSLRHRGVLRALVTFAAAVGLYLLALRLQGKLGLWYVETLGAASSIYRISPGGALGHFLRMFVPVYLDDQLLYPVIGLVALRGLLDFGSYLLEARSNPADESRGLLAFLGVLGAAGVAQGTVAFDFFRLVNACLPLLVVCAFCLHRARSPEGTTHRASRWSLVHMAGVGVAFCYLFTRFPNATFRHRLAPFDDRLLPAPAIRIFRGHRFAHQERAYYERLYRGLCVTSQGPIYNLSTDSTIPYLCQTPRNATGLPFWGPAMVRLHDRRAADELDACRFARDARVVAYDNVTACRDHLVLLDEFLVPPSVIFLGGHSVGVYSVRSPMPSLRPRSPLGDASPLSRVAPSKRSGTLAVRPPRVPRASRH